MERSRKDALQKAARAASRGCLMGLVLKGGLSTVSLLRKPRGFASKASSAARYGLAIGTVTGLSSLLEDVFRAGGVPGSPFFAGAVAGQALRLTGPERHNSLALYLLMRALLLGVRVADKHASASEEAASTSEKECTEAEEEEEQEEEEKCRVAQTPSASAPAPAPVAPTASQALLQKLMCVPRWEHSDTLLMCVSSSIILSFWLMLPEAVTPSYLGFLNKHGGKTPAVQAGVREIVSRNASGEANPRPLRAIETLGLAPPTHPRKSCDFLHPGQGCHEHFAKHMIGGFGRALPVYAAVYLAPAVAVHGKRLAREPQRILSKAILGAGRSSLFLATYCALAWYALCLNQRVRGRLAYPELVGACAAAGLSTLIEKKSRRLELGLYCMARALEVSWEAEMLRRGRRGSAVPRVDLFAFSLSVGGIYYCLRTERDIFKSKYLHVLDWVYGNDEERRSTNKDE
mmetsp:Transcript_28858/g.94322  ORF Transcript_28858/g.94322 Transcript_28858/m.94322 type:complete len:460 (-) Transcript_28858:811-2190(-)